MTLHNPTLHVHEYPNSAYSITVIQAISALSIEEAMLLQCGGNVGGEDLGWCVMGLLHNYPTDPSLSHLAMLYVKL